jgi:hypothetical protein
MAARFVNGVAKNGNGHCQKWQSILPKSAIRVAKNGKKNGRTRQSKLAGYDDASVTSRPRKLNCS